MVPVEVGSGERDPEQHEGDARRDEHDADVVDRHLGLRSLGQVQGALSPATVAIVTFALCGFANFSSIAIQMAVTGNLAPSQRPVIARLGVKALVAGSLANLMSAALAGLMLSLR